jgi:pimeloyl-ACP methyl ester carboxylesterase
MNLRFPSLLSLALLTALTTTARGQTPSAINAVSSLPSSAPAQTGYAPVHGLRLYYEIHGPADSAQPPLVLLHGGGDTIETSFGHVLPELARNRKIIAFEQQGYGHTADIADRPFTFEQTADDTAALLDYLHIERADFLGFSNGGTIALQIAIRHPKLVRKLIVTSTFFSREGGDPSFWASMKDPKFEQMPNELKVAYREVAPHPENLHSFFEKAAARMRDFRDIPVETLRAITPPTLVVNGDADVVRPEHALALFHLLPHARVAIFPATDHMAMMTRTSWLVPMVDDFLNSDSAR